VILARLCRSAWFAGILLVQSLLPFRLAAQTYTYVSVNYPGAGYNAPSAVNDKAQVVGSWQDGSGTLHGYYWDGTNYTSIDYPGSTGTEALGINNAGVISGLYETEMSTQVHGFILKDGTFTSYDYPGFVGQTDGTGINNNGVTTGYYDFDNETGFTYTNGGFNSFNYPGAEYTYAFALNDNEQVAGYYRVGSTNPIGFLYSGGKFTAIEYPADYQSEAYGINNAGVVVGWSYINDPPYEQGWLWQNGTFTPITASTKPLPYGINNNGQLVGLYATGGGFLATPTSSAQPSQFVTMAPCRIVDTRNSNGTFGGPAISGNNSRSFPLSASNNPCSIPSSAVAYSLNVPVVPRGPLNYLTIWPTGQTQPVVSTMNSPDGRVKANAAIVPAGTPSGSVSVYVTNTSDVILDIDGFFTAPGSGSLQFYPLTPCRVIDTRGAKGDLGGPSLLAKVERDFPVRESNCIPSGLTIKAYSMNFTVVPSPTGQPLGYLTVWPQGLTQPQVSTLNNPTATVVANAAIVPAGANGGIATWPYNTTDLVVDINGYFAAPGQSGYNLYPVTPCRAFDSRNNNGKPFTGPIAVPIASSPCEPPGSAAGYVFNATVVPSPTLGYLTLWADGQKQPVVSTLNAYDGFVTSNMAIVPNSDGSTDAFAGQGSTQLILDISGYFAP
jgi:probable HAF family extracellular repeat protein